MLSQCAWLHGYCDNVEFFARPAGDPAFDYWAFNALRRDRSPYDGTFSLNSVQKASVLREQGRWSEEQTSVVFRGWCLQHDGSIRF